MKTLVDNPPVAGPKPGSPSHSSWTPRKVPTRRPRGQTTLAKQAPNFLQPKKDSLIVACIDVGWGNTLYLRGEGGGLSWGEGVPMACLQFDKWIWAFPDDDPPRAFKFLRNDVDWCLGDNLCLHCDNFSVYTPRFSST